MERYSEVSKIWKLRTHAFVIWRGLIFSKKLHGCLVISSKTRRYKQGFSLTLHQAISLYTIMAKIKVENTEITVVSVQNEDYISLTDMAHSQMQEHIVFRWMSLKSTIEYLGEWEMLYNPSFNCTEFDTIRNAAGSNNFVLSVKAWIERTGAIGIMAKAKPFIKWVGEKEPSHRRPDDRLPADFGNWGNAAYIDPFVGGGAMLFYMLQRCGN